ncbi:hypothetical protein HDU96_008597 [Phlyctochytrium bullatum]|nr:hypothetical protein HDU96_008597 [Phlyctochytrium bullatum]
MGKASSSRSPSTTTSSDDRPPQYNPGKMLLRWLPLTLLLLLLTPPHATAAIIALPDPQVLQFAYGCGGPCRSHYRWLLQEHQRRNPSRSFIELYQYLLTTGDTASDLYDKEVLADVFATLPSPARQRKMIEKNAFANLDSVYQKFPWNAFPKTYRDLCSGIFSFLRLINPRKLTATRNGTTYAFCVPVNIFAQKVMYRPSVFAHHNIPIPTSFSTLLGIQFPFFSLPFTLPFITAPHVKANPPMDACTAFAQRNKTLLFFGLKENILWPIQYIFGALFTRLNGGDAYERLLSGSLPWTSLEMTTTMAHWKRMIDAGCFASPEKLRTFNHIDTWRWWMPSAADAEFAMTLMPTWYNYYRADGPEPLVDGDVPSMPFPTVEPAVPRVEVISIEALAVNSASTILPLALEAIEFFTGEEAHRQGLLNGGVASSFIPGIGSLNSSDYLMLSRAAKVVIWFDGIAGPLVSSYAFAAFRDFLLNQTTWSHHAKALDNLSLEENFKTTPAPTITINTTRSGPLLDPPATHLDTATLVLEPTTSNALTYYTLDNTDPIIGISPLYQQPLTLTAPRTPTSPPQTTFTVRARSFKPSLDRPSAVATFTVVLRRSDPVCPLGCVYGVCVEDGVCVCDAFHAGVGCAEEIPVEATSLATPVGRAVVAVGVVLMMAYAGMLAAFVGWYRHKVVRTATASAMVLICVGCMVALGSLFFGIGEPTVFSCNVRHWMVTAGFGLVWGNILAKGFRIYRLFHNTTGRSMVIPNSTILLVSALITSLDLLPSLLLTLIAPLKPTIVLGTTKHDWDCQSDRFFVSRSLLIASIVYNGGLVCAGVLLAVATRHVHSDYNESQLLGYTTFTFAIAASITLPLFTLPALTSPAKTLLHAAAVFLLTGIVMTVFCGSKLVAVLADLGYLGLSSTNSSVDYAPVTPSDLAANAARRRESRMGDPHPGTHVAVRLAGRAPGPFSRWLDCVAVRIPDLDALVITRTDTAAVLFAARASACRVVEVVKRDGKRGDVWTGVVVGPGQRTFRVMADEEETVRGLVAGTGSRWDLKSKGRLLPTGSAGTGSGVAAAVVAQVGAKSSPS